MCLGTHSCLQNKGMLTEIAGNAQWITEEWPEQRNELAPVGSREKKSIQPQMHQLLLLLLLLLLVVSHAMYWRCTHSHTHTHTC